MSVDDSGLSNCVVFSCRQPAWGGGAYCMQHVSLIPAPSPPAPLDDTPLPEDPTTIPPALERPAPPVPDMATMEPRWTGTQWVLEQKKPLGGGPDLEAMRDACRQMMAELGIREDG